MAPVRPSLTERLTELQERVKTLSEAYYRGEPVASDLEYDWLCLELRNLEAKLNVSNPRIGAAVQIGKEGTFPHGLPMLSLHTETDDSYTGYKRFIQFLLNWMIEKGIDTSTIALEAQYKMDGLGLNIQYYDGRLLRVMTRNDGLVGEDVTQCLELFRDTIPELLLDNVPGLLEIRGEAVLSNTEFHKLNTFLESHGQATRSNPRNAVAGLVRTKEPSRYPEVTLNFFPYGLGLHSLETVQSESELMAQLSKWGFAVEPWFRELFVVVPQKELNAKDGELFGPYGFFLQAKDRRASPDFNYLADGVVYKVDSFSAQKTLGYRTTEPRWAVAQKFPPVAMPTVLRSVVFDVGRTGKITPVAEVDPVDIGGVTVSRATLHNVFDIRRRNVRINDEVVIYRSGDTIPEIGYRSKALSRYVYRPNIRLPKTCPACGGALIREKGEINTYCVSPFCAGRNKALLRYFVSKDGMDIQGFGPALVNRLYDAQLIGSYNDIFNLDKETLVHFGVPAVMAEKIVEQIELALRKEDWRFLSSIGIRRVGRATAKQICRLFKLEDLPTLTLDQWRQIPDVDEKTAQYLFAYFQSSGNVSSFKAMDWWAGARFLNTQVDPFRKLYNKSVVFSGSFKPPHRREFLETVVGVEGGLVSKEVTKNTNALVVGDNPTPRKLEKAKELNIPVWSSAEFLQFTGEAPY